MRVFLNLRKGLDRIGVRYRVNDYRHARQHPDETVCIVGKSWLLDATAWRNPIVFGASVFSHPIEDPHLLERLPIIRILVPGEWMRKMWEPYYGDTVVSWPVGIDTDLWTPSPAVVKQVDVLLYDKVLWEHDVKERSLIDPIRAEVRRRGLTIETLRYGKYRENEFHDLLRRCRAMVFLCEHETQGIAYQQALSCDVPIFAWDRGGYWQDPSFFPTIRFSPVSSVPYWDDRCGMKFRDAAEFRDEFDSFWSMVQCGGFSPRSFILEHLTLENCAERYVRIVHEAKSAHTDVRCGATRLSGPP